MEPSIDGLHHVTAIAADALASTEFYRDTLGLRLVKQTVNHDEPETMHLYFGDADGTPGSPITFFVWQDPNREGQFGAGQTKETLFSIGHQSLDFWRQRLDDQGVQWRAEERFGQSTLYFDDPDGIALGLVAVDGATEFGFEPWEASDVPARHQLCGFFGVTLEVSDVEATAKLLEETMGYASTESDDHRRRLVASGERPASVVDLLSSTRARGEMGAGTVHHVAFRVPDAEALEMWRQRLIDAGLSPTEPIDRHYFTSIYTRESQGILFEFATCGPGFERDEEASSLGEKLVLPPQLEARRDELEALLPDISR